MDYFKTSQTTRHWPEDMNFQKVAGRQPPPAVPPQYVRFPRERRGLWKARWGPESRFTELYLEDGVSGLFVSLRG